MLYPRPWPLIAYTIGDAIGTGTIATGASSASSVI